jgi:hypothetical protein
MWKLPLQAVIHEAPIRSLCLWRVLDRLTSGVKNMYKQYSAKEMLETKSAIKMKV